MTAYAELQVTSNYTFLEGGSHADELALTAAALGLSALAVTDRNSLAGIVRAHAAAKTHGVRAVVGCRLELTDSPFPLLVYPQDRAAYARLSQLLTIGKRRAPKAECHLTMADVIAHADGLHAVLVPPDTVPESLDPALQGWRRVFGSRLSLAASHHYRGDDIQRLARLAQLAEQTRVPLLATNDVLYHSPERRMLQDVLTCIRHHTTIDAAGWRLEANAERHLKAPAEMARLFRHHPAAITRALDLADACRFSLDELRYEYPEEVANGQDPQDELARLTWEGAARRFPPDLYPHGIPEHVRRTVDHEIALIGQLSYAPYFLTVYDIIRFADQRGILCQGRGSAANSAVCYCLGITAVDPTKVDLLFERFISAERGEPPDIDVDFEHERREEVFQYIYEKYGRDRAGLTATVITYRTRSAIRDVGKALGLSVDVTARLAKAAWRRGDEPLDDERVREQGLDPAEPRLRMAVELAADLRRFPRHLSQHVGGFVITRGPLSALSPILNAAMADRTTIEWDKDDIDTLGILKVDILALGMLSAIRRAFDLLARHYGRDMTLATIPAEDPAVYDMLCRADSVGVFQVESRAQMNMLPRLRPRNFYDLVIEVAIVRPGPIQGDMVHPYLRRRHGEEPVSFPSPELRAVLGKTLGVPLFQEQAMRIAIVAAGFTPSEADQLRRAMATFRRTGLVHTFAEKFIGGMVANGYARDFAERCFHQIEGFGDYGFPESHAASFALLVYVSAWIKCHYPDVFAAALLNSQPMGFYAPAQLVRDALEHGVSVREPDVNASDWDCTLEPASSVIPAKAGIHLTSNVAELVDPRLRGGDNKKKCALRLGLRQIKGFAAREAEKIEDGRTTPYATPEDLWRRAGLAPAVMERLARADAFRSMGLDRRAALWAVRALGSTPLPLFAGLAGEARDEPAVTLPTMPLGEHVSMDYATLTLSLKAHPLSLLRSSLPGMVTAERLRTLKDGVRLTLTGLVLMRQRPGTANGVLFVTLEDETGSANLVVMPPVFDRFRKDLLAARLLTVTGRVDRAGEVVHVQVHRAEDQSWRLAALVADTALTAPSIFPEGRNFR